MNKHYKKCFTSDKHDIPVPEIPKSITFYKNNPFFSMPEKEQEISENIEDEDFPHLTSKLNSTIMEQRKADYFNQKIFDFNQGKKNLGLGFLSDECRNQYFSQEKIVKNFKKKHSKISYLSDRTEESHLGTQADLKMHDKTLLINDTLDFLKKMQNFDLFEEEFLLGEKIEFEKDVEYFNYLDCVVREEERSSKIIKEEFPPKKISFSSTTKTSLTNKGKFQ